MGTTEVLFAISWQNQQCLRPWLSSKAIEFPPCSLAPLARVQRHRGGELICHSVQDNISYGPPLCAKNLLVRLLIKTLESCCWKIIESTLWFVSTLLFAPRYAIFAMACMVPNPAWATNSVPKKASSGKLLVPAQTCRLNQSFCGSEGLISVRKDKCLALLLSLTCCLSQESWAR